MEIPTFTQIVGDEEVFAREYFDRKPLLRRQALTGAYADLLTIEDVDDLLHSEVLRPPYVRLAKDGQAVPKLSYTRTLRIQGETITDCIVPEQVVGHFRTGASINLNSLNHIRPNLRALAAMFVEKFASRVDVVAFLTPAGREGFQPHYDPLDVFVLQLRGTKYWRVWDTPEERDGKSRHLTLDELGQHSHEVSLSPGDVLYLPYGTPHVAAAEDSMSLHLSVTVVPRKWQDLLSQIVGDILASEEGFDSRPYLSRSHPGLLARTLDEKLELLATRFAGVDRARTMDSLITTGIDRAEGSQHRTSLADVASSEFIHPDSAVRIHPDAGVSIGSPSGQKAQVFVRGNEYAVEAVIAERIDHLTKGRSVVAGEFITGNQTASLGVVRRLAEIGAVTIQGTHS